jgi:hypothetical protein
VYVPQVRHNRGVFRDEHAEVDIVLSSRMRDSYDKPSAKDRFLHTTEFYQRRVPTKDLLQDTVDERRRSSITEARESISAYHSVDFGPRFC